MAARVRRRATYEDVLAAPPHKVAEIIDGELVLNPRPGGAHAAAASALGEELGPPFQRGRGGPGGWIILDEPELRIDPEKHWTTLAVHTDGEIVRAIPFEAFALDLALLWADVEAPGA
jgi:hypothetical protein